MDLERRLLLVPLAWEKKKPPNRLTEEDHDGEFVLELRSPGTMEKTDFPRSTKTQDGVM